PTEAGCSIGNLASTQPCQIVVAVRPTGAYRDPLRQAFAEDGSLTAREIVGLDFRATRSVVLHASMPPRGAVQKPFASHRARGPVFSNGLRRLVTDLRNPELVAAACQTLREGWQRGAGVRVEDLLEEHAALRDEAE